MGIVDPDHVKVDVAHVADTDVPVERVSRRELLDGESLDAVCLLRHADIWLSHEDAVAVRFVEQSGSEPGLNENSVLDEVVHVHVNFAHDVLKPELGTVAGFDYAVPAEAESKIGVVDPCVQSDVTDIADLDIPEYGVPESDLVDLVVRSVLTYGGLVDLHFRCRGLSLFKFNALAIPVLYLHITAPAIGYCDGTDLWIGPVVRYRVVVSEIPVFSNFQWLTTNLVHTGDRVDDAHIIEC